ncbi:hypothetical protein [Nocardiopsis synnemataformans]|uniref:hypothetical protein n=1 Tax=Nocardiopsis synnemataformans TaxID=61305 RepID=UPI003EC04693
MHLICEHPGWQTNETGRRRTVLTATDVWLALAGEKITTTRISGGSGPGPSVDLYDPADLSDRTPSELRSTLVGQGPVQRLRNPDLWDALATAIIRQVIRADQARLMYQRVSKAFGAPAEEGPHPFPTPRTVLALRESDFAELGMKFKARPLTAAAQAFIELGDRWAELPPEDLVAEVQAVPRIGPWTAGAALADYTGDFSFYPYGDMAVRKWAADSVPGFNWPTDELSFARLWRTFVTTSSELSTLTVLTLALGGPRGQDQPPS